jgi:hypothetical protein
MAALALSASAPAFWPPSAQAGTSTTTTTSRVVAPANLQPSQVRSRRGGRGPRARTTIDNNNASVSTSTHSAGEAGGTNAETSGRPKKGKRKPRGNRRRDERAGDGSTTTTTSSPASSHVNGAARTSNANSNGPPVESGGGGGNKKKNSNNNKKKKPAAPKKKKAPNHTTEPASTPSKGWWGKSEEMDPITMEPISHLRYPPFELHADSGGTRQERKPGSAGDGDDSGGSNEVVHLFDGKVLAQYIVSTGTFLNPNNRHELSRETCRRLDAYLRTHRLGKPVVTEAFDLSRLANISASGSSAERQAALRREAAALLGNMFQFNRYTPGDAIMLGDNGGSEQQQQQSRAFTGTNQRARQRALDSGVAPSLVHEDGNFAVIDGDDWVSLQNHGGLDTMDFPGLDAVAPRPANPSSATARVWGNNPVRHGDFPSLEEAQSGGGSGNNSSSASVWAAASASGSTVRAAPVAAIQRPAHVIMREAAEFSTARYSAGLGGSGSGGAALDDVANWRTSSSSAAYAASGSGGGNVRMMPSATNVEELLCPYPPGMLSEARSFGLNWVVKLESRLYNFVVTNTTSRTMELGEMPANKRKFVHELCHNYWALETASKYWDEHREIFVSRTSGAAPPEVSVVQAISDFPDAAASTWDGAVQASGHAVGLWSMTAHGSAPPSAAQVHEAVEQTARRSEYSVRFLDPHNALVEFASLSNARRACNVLKERLASGRQMGALRVTRVQWWPSGLSWASHQLRMREEGERHERQAKRAQRRVIREYETANVRRAESRVVATAWDSDGDDNNDGQMMPTQAAVPRGGGATGALARSGGGLARSGGGLAQSGGRFGSRNRGGAAQQQSSQPAVAATAAENKWGALDDDEE